MMKRYVIQALLLGSIVTDFFRQSTVSAIVEEALSNLARKHETTRFVKLVYQEAEMDMAAVPAILAYKGSELIANLVSLIDEIPAGRDMGASSLEWLLQRYVLILSHLYIYLKS